MLFSELWSKCKLSIYYRWLSWGTEILNNLFRFTELLSGSTRPASRSPGSAFLPLHFTEHLRVVFGFGYALELPMEPFQNSVVQPQSRPGEFENLRVVSGTSIFRKGCYNPDDRLSLIGYRIVINSKEKMSWFFTQYNFKASIIWYLWNWIKVSGLDVFSLFEFIFFTVVSKMRNK